MPRISFDDLPDRGRLWVFPATGPLTEEVWSTFGPAVDEFLDQWAAHGSPLRSGSALLHGRFLVVGVDEDAEKPSGCSIDALVRRLRSLGGEAGVSIVDHAPVWYRDESGVRSVSRAEFRGLAERGEVSVETPVFDTSLTVIGDLRAGRFEKAAGESWHGRAFFRDSVPG